MYAVVETGGKQYRVEVGQTIAVERLAHDPGSTVELERVLLVGDGDQVAVGRPLVPGAKVVAEVVGQGRGKKVTVFKYKPKVRYRVKRGHRQSQTRLSIKEIVTGPRRVRRRRSSPRSDS